MKQWIINEWTSYLAPNWGKRATAKVRHWQIARSTNCTVRCLHESRRMLDNLISRQGIAKRCRLSWLTNSALVYPGGGGGEGGCGISANEYSRSHGAQINFGDLVPYLTFVTRESIDHPHKFWGRIAEQFYWKKPIPEGKHVCCFSVRPLHFTIKIIRTKKNK